MLGIVDQDLLLRLDQLLDYCLRQLILRGERRARRLNRCFAHSSAHLRDRERAPRARGSLEARHQHLLASRADILEPYPRWSDVVDGAARGYHHPVDMVLATTHAVDLDLKALSHYLRPSVHTSGVFTLTEKPAECSSSPAYSMQPYRSHTPATHHDP